MSSRFELIAQQLLQKSFFDCTISELQQLTEQHPYMAPAQFLLAKKMQQEGAPEARAQMQKAALYYHQPAIFDAFLNSEFPEMDSFYGKAELNEEKEEIEEPLHFAVNLPTHADPVSAPMPEAMEVVPPTPQVEALAVEEVQEMPLQKAEGQPQLTVTPETPPIVATEPAPPALPEATQHEKMPVQQETETLAFEPFHTVDYFASQGIRLSQEEATKDKMGKQLKSFTQWLKTMKRLPATEQLKNLDPHAEKNVESMAAHSVEDTEIVTEAMAEVWLKQGNLSKAAEIYQKLSLSNPSKRAYFASKLESLKKNV